MTADEFRRMYNSWNINQRIDWEYFASQQMHGTRAVPQWRIDEIVRQWITETYGHMAAYLSNAEIGPILMRAGREGWAPERLDAVMKQTNFWKTTSESQRQWDLLGSQDPATANAQREQMASRITQLLSQAGVVGQYTAQRISDLANQLLRNGVPEDQVPQSVLADAQYTGGHPEGKLGALMSQIQALAADHLVPMSDEGTWDYAKSIMMGATTMDGVSEFVRNMSSGRFTHLADDIARGVTPKQLMNPYIQQTAQLLERSPDDIDLNDSRFLQMVDHVDPQTNQRRLMTLSESQKFIKSSEDYGNSKNGMKEAASLGEFIGQKFGKVA